LLGQALAAAALRTGIFNSVAVFAQQDIPEMADFD
jgi:hypothetical protein